MREMSSLRCGRIAQGIFMTGYMSQVNNNRANTCPHGLPLGACPICNGMGGGGSTKRADEPRRPGEMTYQECYAQWKQMQRAEAREKAMQEAMLKNAELADKMQKQLANLTNNISNMLDKIQNVLPKPVAKVFGAISNNILKPILNIVKNFPQLIRDLPNLITNIRNEIARAAEKLSALIGEVQNFIEKKISDITKSLKKQFRKFLSLFGLEEEYEEDEKIEEEMKVFKQFEIEKLKEAIRKLITPKDKENKIAASKNEHSTAKV